MILLHRVIGLNVIVKSWTKCIIARRVYLKTFEAVTQDNSYDWLNKLSAMRNENQTKVNLIENKGYLLLLWIVYQRILT